MGKNNSAVKTHSECSKKPAASVGSGSSGSSDSDSDSKASGNDDDEATQGDNDDNDLQKLKSNPRALKAQLDAEVSDLRTASSHLRIASSFALGFLTRPFFSIFLPIQY